jgi:hypothetical protein
MSGDCSGNVEFESAGVGSFWSSPGIRKVAGETLCDEFIPLQPVAIATKAGTSSRPTAFLFNFTGGVV